MGESVGPLAERVCVIACGALAREILAVTAQAGLDHVDLRCLPAILHNHPERIVPEVAEAVRKARADGYGHVLVGYGDCGTGGGLERLAAREGFDLLPGAHCYAFFAGTGRFAAWDECDAFYLTDFLARQFDAFVVRPLKLDRHPELIDMMFAHYGRVVHLEQVADAETREAAARAAERLHLPLERRTTGYGDLAVALERL